MDTVTDLVKNTPIPRMVKIRENYDRTHVPAEKIRDTVMQELSRDAIASKIRPGMRIAITCGSRGINNVPVFVRAIVDFVKSRGAVPFIVPAMGSHGGATAEGQVHTLTGLGVTEESMGCEIKSTMETVVVGISPVRHIPVHIDKYAAEADGIIVFNRVKPHTSFHGPYESGLMKMMVVGLGNQVGANSMHSRHIDQFHERLEEFGKTILANAPVICGLAVVENAYHESRVIRALTPQEIIDEEPKLKELAYKTIAHILFPMCDVLVVDQIGKNISGDGMDPNVTGRYVTSKLCTGGIVAEKVVVLSLTKETAGNAQGIGLADVTTRRAFDQLDLEATYPNVVTNTFTHLAKIPMIMDNDREALQLALMCCPEAEDQKNLKMIRIRDTGQLENIEISEGMLPLARKNPNIEILSEPFELQFDENGNLF